MGTLRHWVSVAAITFALALLMPHTAFAHAILVRSTPAEHASVKPGDVDILLTYNSRIDASRCSLMLVGPDGKQQTLALDAHAAANVLKTRASGLSTGAYKLEWQVLASDGHITRGVVDFRVG